MSNYSDRQDQLNDLIFKSTFGSDGGGLDFLRLLRVYFGASGPHDQSMDEVIFMLPRKEIFRHCLLALGVTNDPHVLMKLFFSV